MNAKEFFDRFNEAISINNCEAVEKYLNGKAFTKVVISAINSIINENPKYTQNELYRIDSIGWSDVDLPIDCDKKIPRFKEHLWNLDVAVEHENDSKDWMYEVVKLVHVYCPLRVVISYLPLKSLMNVNKGDMAHLDYIVEKLKNLKSYDNMKQGEFLVIIGNSNVEKIEDFFNYKGYLFSPTEERFIEIC